MRNKSTKYYIILMLILVLSITIGYAALNSTLNINGKSNISKNTWDVHFDNIVVKDSSVEAIKAPTIENNTTVDFEVALNLPGDFYEFTVDVVNAGSIDAMIESITKEPELTEAQQKYLNYIIEYENGEPIITKQLVEKESFVRLKVKVELRKDINPADLPDVVDALYLSFTVNYIQADESGINIGEDTENKPVANGSLNKIGTIVTIGTEKFYVIENDGEKVKLFAMHNLYVGGEYDGTTYISYGDEATGMQDENMKGYVPGQSIRHGVSPFSSNAQKGNNYNDYVGSIVETYVNDYKKILEEKYGITVLNVGLLSQNDLSNKLSCELNEPNNTCICSFFEWSYSTSYWVNTVLMDENVGSIKIDGSYYLDFYDSLYYGVRPYIYLSLNEIIVLDDGESLINFSIDGISYQSEIGMTWEEWINSEYNTHGNLVIGDFTDVPSGVKYVWFGAAGKRTEQKIKRLYSSITAQRYDNEIVEGISYTQGIND